MADLIDRQALLDTLDTYWKNEVDKIPKETGFEKLASMCDTILKYSNAIAKLIKHLSSAQPEPQWIPCSERLPDDVEIGEEYPTVIFCTSDGAVYVGGYEHYLGGKWWYMETWEDEAKGVIAWMPLPEPWRGEEHETD